MTFPHDHLREVERVEDHSGLAIVIVSVLMIVLALTGVSYVLA